MADNNPIPLNLNVDPVRTPIYTADGYLISTNEHSLVFNFLQALPANNQQQIIARISLSRDQAKEFSKMLDDHIQKFEI